MCYEILKILNWKFEFWIFTIKKKKQTPQIKERGYCRIFKIPDTLHNNFLVIELGFQESSSCMPDSEKSNFLRLLIAGSC